MNGTVPRTIGELKFFPKIAALFHVESGTKLATGKTHRRIELITKALLPEQIDYLMRTRVQCCACHQPMHPFRPRKRKSAGRAERPGRLFVSVACDLSVNVGCARGHAASEATSKLVRAIQGDR